MSDLNLMDLPKLKGKSLIATFDVNAGGDLVIHLREIIAPFYSIASIDGVEVEHVSGKAGIALEPMRLPTLFLNMVKPFIGMIGKGKK